MNRWEADLRPSSEGCDRAYTQYEQMFERTVRQVAISRSEMNPTKYDKEWIANREDGSHIPTEAPDVFTKAQNLQADSLGAKPK